MKYMKQASKIFILFSADRNGKRPCPQCTKVISNKSNLLKHIRIRHSDAYNPACCLLCNKMFKNKYSLRAHLNIYHKEYISPNAPQQAAPGAPASAPPTPEQPSPTGNYPVTPASAAQQHYQSTIPT
ncbi:BTB/POZ domain [Nesidiocoris tenuis]|uniref:BTB/POZ domain n=1 Tax=Nesidiocoris tenuis TaxID=355587 RepID=A0ABN7B7R3_9HEMI|nr:BTB/POZ domain [Nesidiocoris tenuis]